MVLDKSLEIGVNIISSGGGQLDSLANKADELTESLGGVATTTEATESTISDLNRELYEASAASSSASASMTNLQSQLIASRLSAEGLSGEIDDLVDEFDDIDNIEPILGEIFDNADDTLQNLIDKRDDIDDLTDLDQEQLEVILTTAADNTLDSEDDPLDLRSLFESDETFDLGGEEVIDTDTIRNELDDVGHDVDLLSHIVDEDEKGLRKGASRSLSNLHDTLTDLDDVDLENEDALEGLRDDAIRQIDNIESRIRDIKDLDGADTILAESTEEEGKFFRVSHLEDRIDEVRSKIERELDPDDPRTTKEGGIVPDEQIAELRETRKQLGTALQARTDEPETLSIDFDEIRDEINDIRSEFGESTLLVDADEEKSKLNNVKRALVQAENAFGEFGDEKLKVNSDEFSKATREAERNINNAIEEFDDVLYPEDTDTDRDRFDRVFEIGGEEKTFDEVRSELLSLRNEMESVSDADLSGIDRFTLADRDQDSNIPTSLEPALRGFGDIKQDIPDDIADIDESALGGDPDEQKDLADNLQRVGEELQSVEEITKDIESRDITDREEYIQLRDKTINRLETVRDLTEEISDRHDEDMTILPREDETDLTVGELTDRIDKQRDAVDSALELDDTDDGGEDGGISEFDRKKNSFIAEMRDLMRDISEGMAESVESFEEIDPEEAQQETFKALKDIFRGVDVSSRGEEPRELSDLQIATLADAMTTVKPRPFDSDAPGQEPSSETVTTSLIEIARTTDSDALRRSVLDLTANIDEGKLGLPSIVETDTFKSTLESLIEGDLRDLDIDPDAVDDMAESLANAFAQAGKQSDKSFVSEMIDAPRVTDDTFDTFFEGIEDDDRQQRLQSELYDDIVDILNNSVEDAAQALKADVDPDGILSGDRTIGTIFTADPSELRDNLSDMERQYKQSLDSMMSFLDASDERLKESPYFSAEKGGIGPKAAVFRGLTAGMQRFTFGSFGDADNVGEARAKSIRLLEAMEDIKELTIDNLIPTKHLKNVTANLGNINFRAANTLGIIYALTAAIGPFVMALGGLVTGLVAAAGALAAFGAVGALGVLKSIEEQMAGVNSRAEAMQELMSVMKDRILDAVEPLRNVQIGGDGMGGMEFFMASLNRIVDLVNTISDVFAHLIETEGFANMVQKVGDAFFSASDGGTSMKEAMEVLSNRILPHLTNILVALIERFPEFITFMSKIGDIVLRSFGPVFNILMDVAGAVIVLGTALFAVVGHLLQVVNALQDLYNWIGETLGITDELNGVMTALIVAFGLLAGSVWALGTAMRVLSATFVVWNWVVLKSIAQVSTLAFTQTLLETSSLSAAAAAQAHAIAETIKNSALGTGIGIIVSKIGALGIYTASTISAALGTWTLTGAVYALAAPVTAVIVAIGALAAGLYVLQKRFDIFGRAAELASNIVDQIQQLEISLLDIATMFSPILLLVRGIKWAFDAITDNMNRLLTLVSTLANTFDPIRQASEDIKDVWNSINQNIEDSISAAESFARLIPGINSQQTAEEVTSSVPDMSSTNETESKDTNTSTQQQTGPKNTDTLVGDAAGTIVDKSQIVLNISGGGLDENQLARNVRRQIEKSKERLSSYNASPVQQR